MKKIPCEVYTRVVGYYRPVQNWNLGKSEEYYDRVPFSEKDSLNTEVNLDNRPLDERESVIYGAHMCSDCLKLKEFIEDKPEIQKMYVTLEPSEIQEAISRVAVKYELTDIALPIAVPLGERPIEGYEKIKEWIENNA